MAEGKVGKGGGAPKAERPETAERTEAQKEKDEAKNWVELEKQEYLAILAPIICLL